MNSTNQATKQSKPQDNIEEINKKTQESPLEDTRETAKEPHAEPHEEPREITQVSAGKVTRSRARKVREIRKNRRIIKKQTKTQKISKEIAELSDTVKISIKSQTEEIQRFYDEHIIKDRIKKMNEKIEEENRQKEPVLIDFIGVRMLEIANQFNCLNNTPRVPIPKLPPGNYNQSIRTGENPVEFIDYRAEIEKRLLNELEDPSTCQYPGCRETATHARIYYEPEYCKKHANRHCINAANRERTCIFPNCKYAAEYNFNFTTYPLYCAHHAPDNVEVDIITEEQKQPTRGMMKKLKQLRETFASSHNISDMSTEHTRYLVQFMINNIRALKRMKQLARTNTEDNPNKYVSAIDLDAIRHYVDLVPDDPYDIDDYTTETRIDSKIHEIELSALCFPNFRVAERTAPTSNTFHLSQDSSKKTEHCEPIITDEWYNSLFK